VDLRRIPCSLRVTAMGTASHRTALMRWPHGDCDSACVGEEEEDYVEREGECALCAWTPIMRVRRKQSNPAQCCNAVFSCTSHSHRSHPTFAPPADTSSPDTRSPPENRPSQTPMSTQPCIPPGSLNRVPASAGVRAGMSPLPGDR